MSEHVKESEHESSGKAEHSASSRPDLRHSASLASSWWQRLITSFLPYLYFHHPEHKPLQYIAHATESFLTIIRASLTSSFKSAPKLPKLLRNVPKLLRNAINLAILLCGSMFAIFFIVYICFAFNGLDKFPNVGDSLRYVLIFRNIVLIALMHYMCFTVCRPNFARIRSLHIPKFAPDTELGYIGVFHSLRRLMTFFSPFQLRWFTTFLSDSLLLGITYIAFFLYGVMMINGASTAHAFSELTNVYRGCLTCGFIIYTLEFAPIVKKKPAFNAICLFTIAMQISDFFLFVFDKQNQGAVQRAFGAGAQLFITHSSVLLAAILGQHHQHASLSADFPLRSVWKIVLVLLIAATWLTYAIYRDQFGHEEYGTMKSHWVPVSYPYALWGLSVLGGLFGLAGAAYYCFCTEIPKTMHSLDQPEEHSNGVVHHDSAKATVKETEPNGVVDSSDAHEGEPSSMVHHDTSASQGESHSESHHSSTEFDIMLIVITFTVSAVYYSSEMFGAFSHGYPYTVTYWITTPLAPIGLAVLAATYWWKPPSSPRIMLYAGLTVAGMLLMSMETAEDCHLNSAVPACCEYPWLPDSNAHMEEPNAAPGCGTYIIGGQCLAPLNDNGVSLLFTSVVAVTHEVDLVVSNNGIEIYREQLTDIASLVYTSTCQDQIVTVNDETYNPGCYGGYLHVIPLSVISVCDPVGSCTVAVTTFNCAYIASEALVFSILDPSQADLTQVDLHPSIVEEKDTVDSTFYSVFKLVGMAALLECFFTLFGVLLKLVFLSECQASKLNI